MTEKCEICGATEKIQRHHISYEPEIIRFLCVDCHKAVHNHGVGKAPGWSTLFEGLKTDAEILFKEGATNKEVANACDISYATASHWRKKLGLSVDGKNYARRLPRKRTTLSLYLSREIYDYLSELAGKDRTPEAEGKRWIEERYKTETEKRGLMKLEKEEKEEDAN